MYEVLIQIFVMDSKFLYDGDTDTKTQSKQEKISFKDSI